MSSFTQSDMANSPCPLPKLELSSSYVEDVLRTMLNDQSDHVFSKFTDSYIRYRRVVVEWMVDVADYFNLHATTTHAAIAYLDRLQPNEKYSRFEWQMMAICCLIISSKYNECEEHVPALHKLEEITQQAMTNECVLNYELWALKRMGWKLNARTPVAFLDSYLHLAQRLPTVDARARENMRCFSCPDFEASVTSLATRCMLDHSFKPLPASAIATGIIYFTRESYMCDPVWTPALSALTGHDAPTSKSVQKVLELLDLMTHDELLATGNLSQSSQNLEDSLNEDADQVGDLCLDASALSLADPAVMENDENVCSASTAAALAQAAALALAQEKKAEFTTPAMKAADTAGKKKLSPVSIADFGA